MKHTSPALMIAGTALSLGLLGACGSLSTFHGELAGEEDNGGLMLPSNHLNGLLYYLPEGRISIVGDFKASQSGSNGKQSTPNETDTPQTDPGNNANQQKSFAVTIAADLEADPTSRCYLKPDRNYFYDDNIHLTINAKHLLSTGNATSQDQTSQIIATLASTAEQLITSFAAKGVPPPKTISVYDLQFKIHTQLEEGGAKLTTSVKVTPNDIQQFENALGPFPDNTKETGQKFAQFLYDKAGISNQSITVQDIRDFLEYYLPSLADREISTPTASHFFSALWTALYSQQSQPAKTTQPKPFNIVFDPENPQMRKYLSNSPPAGTLREWKLDQIEDSGFTVTVEEMKQPDLELRSIWTRSNRNLAHGILFRAVEPYRVTVTSTKLPGASELASNVDTSQLVFLPDRHHTFVLDYSRMPFVAKVTNIGFVDGVPEDFSQTLPSSVLGFVGIPKAIVDALLPNPLQSKPASSPQGNSQAGAGASGGAPAGSRGGRGSSPSDARTAAP
jgi:hypothetical protein